MTPLAAMLLDAHDRSQMLSPPTLSLDEGYRLAVELIAARQARGERLVGRKIGFTNRGLWDRLGVNAPIWGAMWDTTVQFLPEGDTESTLSLRGLMQPKLEPEIVFGLRDAPASDALADVVAAIDWVAHGYEIVQCPYPDWKFTAAAGVAAFGLHARLIVGERVPVASFGGALPDSLAGLTVRLTLNGNQVATGSGAAVLGGPVQSLASLVRLLASQPELPPLRGGEVITTGTLTDAQPLASGQGWQTMLSSVLLSGLRLNVAD